MSALSFSLLLCILLAFSIPHCRGHGGEDEGEKKEVDQDKFKIIPATSASFGDGSFNASWTYTAASSKLAFTVQAQTVGWVGFGWTESRDGKNMKDYDIAVGGKTANGSYLNDFWAETESRPVLDNSSDFTLINAQEADGKTTLEFSRILTTNDTSDFQFDDDEFLYLVWSFGAQDGGPLDFAYHGENRGHSTVKYNLVTGMKLVEAGVSRLAFQYFLIRLLPLAVLLIC